MGLFWKSLEFHVHITVPCQLYRHYYFTQTCHLGIYGTRWVVLAWDAMRNCVHLWLHRLGIQNGYMLPETYTFNLVTGFPDVNLWDKCYSLKATTRSQHLGPYLLYGRCGLNFYVTYNFCWEDWCHRLYRQYCFKTCFFRQTTLVATDMCQHQSRPQTHESILAYNVPTYVSNIRQVDNDDIGLCSTLLNIDDIYSVKSHGLVILNLSRPAHTLLLPLNPWFAGSPEFKPTVRSRT